MSTLSADLIKTVNESTVALISSMYNLNYFTIGLQAYFKLSILQTAAYTHAHTSFPFSFLLLLPTTFQFQTVSYEQTS